METWPWQIVLSDGTTSLVDEVDFPEAMAHSWFANKKGHVQRGCKGRTVYLHVVILERMGLPRPSGGFLADHKNRNGRDNRRSNLRWADVGLSAFNQNARSSKLGLPGVSPNGSKFQAQISVNYKRMHLGLFDTPEEASAAYADACLKYRGEYRGEP